MNWLTNLQQGSAGCRHCRSASSSSSSSSWSLSTSGTAWASWSRRCRRSTSWWRTSTPSTSSSTKSIQKISGPTILRQIRSVMGSTFASGSKAWVLCCQSCHWWRQSRGFCFRNLNLIRSRYHERTWESVSMISRCRSVSFNLHVGLNILG